MATEPNPSEGTPTEKLALAYAVVFGRDAEHRTDAQRLVWQDMQRRGYFYRSTAVPGTDGNVTSVKMEIAEGMRIFFLDVINLVDRAQTLGTQKTKPKVKRK